MFNLTYYGTVYVTDDGFTKHHLNKMNLDFETSPNDCCGARVMAGATHIFSRKGNKNRDFGCPYYWTHTVGIRIFPGKLDGELPLYPGEVVEEIDLGGDTLTVAYVKTFVDFDNLDLERDLKYNTYPTKEVKSPVNLINTKSTVDLLFPTYNGFIETPHIPGRDADWQIKDMVRWGTPQKIAEAKVALQGTRFSYLQAEHLAGKPLFFTVTTDQEPGLMEHLVKYKMEGSIVFHRTKLCNMNYSMDENPRLAIVVVKGKE